VSLDDLLWHAQRYGSTELKRENKRLAREELFARGPDALAYLMEHVHVRNVWIRILAQDLVRKHEGAACAPVLLRFLTAEREETRRFAAYLLGFCDTPEYAGHVVRLLSDDAAAGAAVRTLGKWRTTAAGPVIVSFLLHEKERRRVLAANALRDIGDVRAVSGLIHALNDPFFTVRKAANRALVSFGKQIEKPALAALTEAKGRRRRELVSVLAEIRSRKAIRPLRRMLAGEDAALREDAARALWTIDPGAAGRWLAKAGLDPRLFGLR
jgi:HEAT repeat protein